MTTEYRTICDRCETVIVDHDETEDDLTTLQIDRGERIDLCEHCAQRLEDFLKNGR